MHAFLTSSVSDVQFWQRDVAERLRCGCYARLVVEPIGGLYGVRGIYPDGMVGVVLAKYRLRGRADDVVNLITHLAVYGED